MNTFHQTYLYIKQHTLTGLLYFGKTTKKDPVKYKGSGTYWQNHIKEHGTKYIETLWFCLYLEEEDCTKFALLFSEQQDIVKSKEWANLMPENGVGGGVNTGFDIVVYRKVYNEANKNAIKLHGKAYNEANRDRIRVRDKAYYKANKDAKKLYNKTYKEANKDKIKAYNSVYHVTNRVSIGIYKKAYAEANTEAKRIYDRNRYLARKLPFI
jgi:hypothetical protein